MSEIILENEVKIKKDLANNIEELPKLKENYVRLIHLSSPDVVEEIIKNGLDYSKQGMAMSTARSWADESMVEYGSSDFRFNQPGMKAVVLDISNEEWKMHNKIGSAPGVIPPEKIVGVIDAENKAK